MELRANHSARELLQEELEGFHSAIIKVLECLSEQELCLKCELEEFPESPTPDHKDVNYGFKIVIMGDPAVGKTSTLLRYSDKAFSRGYLPTLGVNLSQKLVYHKNAAVELVLWDLAGQAKYEKSRHQFYRGP